MRFRAVVVVLLASCTTPTIPLPPPEPDSFTFALDATAATATFRAQAKAEFGGAAVYVHNIAQGTGVITTAEDDGSVSETSPFTAADGDRTLVTYVVDEEAVSICVLLHDGPSSYAYRCP